MFEAWIAKLGLSVLFGRLKAVPRWVWYALAAIVLLTIVVIWHAAQVRHVVDQARKEGAAASDAAWQKRFDQLKADADKFRKDAEAKQAAISQEAQNQHAQDLRRIDADARTLRLYGAGKAAIGPGCVNDTGVPGSAGQGGPESRDPNATRPVLPAEQWAAVPWDWLNDRAAQADANLAEVLSWRKWYADQKALSDHLRAEAPK